MEPDDSASAAEALYTREGAGECALPQQLCALSEQPISAEKRRDIWTSDVADSHDPFPAFHFNPELEAARMGLVINFM